VLAGPAEGPALAQWEPIPMAGRNGIAVLPVARKPLRVVPETRTIPIDTGEDTQDLVAYVKGPACPISVLIEADEAINEWEENFPTDEDRKTLKPRQWLAKHNRAERILRRDLLCAVIPGLTPDHAGVLAADDGEWQTLLIELGWWAAPDEMPAEDDDPEATAPAVAVSTGADDSPDSSPVTQEAIPS
jgi:hypothetical protein